MGDCLAGLNPPTQVRWAHGLLHAHPADHVHRVRSELCEFTRNTSGAAAAGHTRDNASRMPSTPNSSAAPVLEICDRSAAALVVYNVSGTATRPALLISCRRPFATPSGHGHEEHLFCYNEAAWQTICRR